MRILVSNDDGIQALGIQALAEALRSLGEVTVVAPDRERSGSSHSLTMHRPLRVEKLDSHHYKVDGTPTDCVNLAVNALLPERPDLVVSGINQGGNLGDDITYSGTVLAAMEGTLLGIPSLAVSLVSRTSDNFGPAARFACRMAKAIMCYGLPPNTFLNVNVPDANGTEPEDYRVTCQGKRIYYVQVVEKTDPRGRKYYWFGGAEPGWKEKKESDFEAIAQNLISITPLHLDLTNHASLDKIRGWKIE